jgi:four helix bundle protein
MWPSEEQFGLISQARRAAVSIGANIAEGSGRGTDRDFARFLRIALGSANELESLLLVAAGLGYLQSEAHGELHRLTREVRKMIAGLVRSLTC